MKLTDAETERARWLLEIQTRHATEDPHIAGFRKLYLFDGLLAPEEAEEFLESIDAPEVESLAFHLKKVHGWHEGEAARWIITGEAPSARPVGLSYRKTCSLHGPDQYLITLETSPWISVKTLADAFAEIKRRMHAERKLPNARAYRVARFVDARLHKAGVNKLTFEDMWREWNRENPSEKFSDWRSFRRVYARLPVELITHPPYNTNIKRETTPEMQRQLDRSRRAAQRLKNAGSPAAADRSP